MGLNSIDDYKRRARGILSNSAWEYYHYRRESRLTCLDSVNAFTRYRIRSEVLQDVSKRSLATTVLGQPLKYPICVAPTAIQTLAHPEGEKATAKGTEAAEALMVMSVASTTRMEEVVDAAPNGHRWMQLYPFADRQLTLEIIRRAQSLGFKALVITVDSPVGGVDGRIHEIFDEEPLISDPSIRMVNYDVDLASSQAAFAEGDTTFNRYMREISFNPRATWDYIRWIKAHTFLPIVVKGILTYQSAQAAADAGVDGILVSAHGGRQMDGAPAPIDALGEVVDAVRGRDVEVYMDGGIRTGSDVFKALGRGARAVFVGRPILWGLACQGAEGVKNVLHLLLSQLDHVLAASGCTSPNSIPEGTVVHESYYHQGPGRNIIKSKL